jgi:hypothetical protein
MTPASERFVLALPTATASIAWITMEHFIEAIAHACDPKNRHYAEHDELNELPCGKAHDRFPAGVHEELWNRIHSIPFGVSGRIL